MRALCISLLMMTCTTMFCAERPTFQTLRYNEDWSFLRDSSRRTDWLDPVKFIPVGLMDLQPGVELALTRCVKLAASCDFVWRESLDDGVYGVALNLQVPPGASRDRYVGRFPTASLAWQVGPHLNLTLNYVAYLFGDFVKESLPSLGNGNYVSAVATFRF